MIVHLLGRTLKRVTRHARGYTTDPKPEGRPIKFTTSKANVDYRATLNFAGDTRDLPPSHNYVLTGSFMFGLTYLYFLRDNELENDGGAALVVPLHEQIPEIAIPMIRSAIAENKRQGVNTVKLEKKLAQLLQESDSKSLRPKLKDI